MECFVFLASWTMIILGVDPGTAATGFGVIRNSKKRGKTRPHLSLVDFGSIKTESGVDMEKRLLGIREGISKVVKEHRPEIMVVEKLFFNVNVKTAMTVSQARGVVMLAAAEQGIPVVEYTALEAKLELTGHGRSKKKEVQKAVGRELGTKKTIRPVHAADALAMAICHVRKVSKSQ